jgi:hypothetical protein
MVHNFVEIIDFDDPAARYTRDFFQYFGPRGPADWLLGRTLDEK